MKKLYYTFFLLLLFLNGFAQTLTPEFEFQLYFEDAVGNRDTVTLGYDLLATDSIDADFGEEDITDIPWKTSGLEVRISNPKNLPYIFPDFESKKQIINYGCDNSNLKQINVFTMNWPINIEWINKSVDSCLKGSIVTSYQPGGWFDVPGPSNMGVIELFRNGLNQLTGAGSITSNVDSSPGYLYPTGYINSNGDTVSVFWMAFASEQLITMDVKEGASNKQMDLYPNPFTDHFEISSQITDGKISIYDLQGREVNFYQEGNRVFPLNCNTGIYLLSIEENGKIYNTKIIKQ